MKATWNQIKNNQDYHLVVGKINNKIVAFAKVTLHHDIFEENNPFISIWSVRVSPKYRNQGIGRQLFQYIEKLAISIHCEFICLIAEKANVTANSFYQKLGYQCENGYVKFLL